MARREIPDNVARFIDSRIDSVPQLEALLLMWENPAKSWTAEQIASRLYVSDDQARAVLQHLRRHGAITPVTGADAASRYNPAWSEADTVPDVVAAYRHDLIQVATLIHAKVPSAVREFARAFQFKKND